MIIRKIYLVLLLIGLFSCSSDNNEITKNPPDDKEDPTPEKNQDGTLHIEQPYFINSDNVKNKTSDPKFLDTMIKLTEGAPKGSSIFLSVYGFSYEPLMDVLLEADKRGVLVHALIDSSTVNQRKTNQLAFSKLGKLKAPSEMIGVNNNLRSGAKAINHEKYMIFSETTMEDGVAKNLVFASSHNFGKGATKKVQDGLLITNQGLYNSFRKNWHRVATLAHDRQGMKKYEYTVDEVEDGLTVRFFPRRKNGSWDGGDDIIEVLNELDEENYSRTTIRVMMAFWEKERKEIIQKLTKISKRGGIVEIIARNTYSDEVNTELKNLNDAGGYVKLLKGSKQLVHSKCMIIKGTIDGQKQEIILSGSHNYTDGGLKYANEFIIESRNKDYFKDYMKYFDELKAKLSDFSPW